MSSTISNIKLLQRNNVELTSENFEENAIQILDNLRTTKNEKLTNNYKLQIGATIKRLFPNVKYNFKKHYKCITFDKKTILPNLIDIMKLVQNAAEEIKNVNSIQCIENIGLYDMNLMVLFSVLTGLRKNEVAQLTLSDLKNIIEKNKCYLRQKGGYNVIERQILISEPLLLLINNVLKQRTYVYDYLETNCINGNQVSKRLKYKDGYIILSSPNHLSNLLKKITKILNLPKDTRGGFNLFRTLISSTLIKEGGHIIAQVLANHKNPNTTLSHYNVLSTQASEDLFKNLTEQEVSANDDNNQEEEDMITNQIDSSSLPSFQLPITPDATVDKL